MIQFPGKFVQSRYPFQSERSGSINCPLHMLPGVHDCNKSLCPYIYIAIAEILHDITNTFIIKIIDYCISRYYLLHFQPLSKPVRNHQSEDKAFHILLHKYLPCQIFFGLWIHNMISNQIESSRHFFTWSTIVMDCSIKPGESIQYSNVFATMSSLYWPHHIHWTSITYRYALVGLVPGSNKHWKV